MEIWRINEKVSALSDVIPYYFFSLCCSCISFSMFMIIYSGELSWLRLLPVIVYSFFSSIPYLLFALPLQIMLNKRPKKFSLVYLLFYIFLSFIAVLLYCMVLGTKPKELILTNFYYGASVVGALFYWFWDSVFLQKKQFN